MQYKFQLTPYLNHFVFAIFLDEMWDLPLSLFHFFALVGKFALNEPTCTFSVEASLLFGTSCTVVFEHCPSIVALAWLQMVARVFVYCISVAMELFDLDICESRGANKVPERDCQ